MSLSQFTSAFLECFHFLVVLRRRIYMRATYICLDVVETVHQTVVHCRKRIIYRTKWTNQTSNSIILAHSFR